MPLDDLRQEVEFGLENLANVYQNIVKFSDLPVDMSLKTSALAFECLGYYNAVEHLIIRILKYRGQAIPSGAFSHRDTLKIFRDLVEARQIDDSASLDTLQTLMAFRHVATKIYGFLIDWPRLQAVVSDIRSHHSQIVNLFEKVVAGL